MTIYLVGCAAAFLLGVGMAALVISAGGQSEERRR